MSTEQQQYSTANQRAAIGEWAAARGVEIVATYEDAGRSGLTLTGRPALRKLIADVLGRQGGFDAILVYDVSRWGRFQDTDESAHLEFICRAAGVSVHYCAEPFSNDGTPIATLCKVMKRALAAEYSRELSEKVSAGKARLALLGFRQGSPPGFGLRRRLVDQNGADKGPLASGERKHLTTDRVILIPGPPEEVATVRWMYEAYAEHGLTINAIRDELNARGIRNQGRPWSKETVRYVLTSPKYIGENYWGMSSGKLLGPRRPKPREQWIRCGGAFEPVVPRTLFEKVRERRQIRSNGLPDEVLL